MAQLHKKFTDDQVKELIKRYLKKEIERSYIEEILDIKRRRFCELVKKYRNDPDNFSIQYKREMPTRNISKDIEENIIKELSIEKNLIADVNVPLKTYNYIYIKDRLEIVYDEFFYLIQYVNVSSNHGYIPLSLTASATLPIPKRLAAILISTFLLLDIL